MHRFGLDREACPPKQKPLTTHRPRVSMHPEKQEGLEMADLSTTWTWFDGAWHEGNPALIGPRSHAFWLGSSVFDGAHAFEGVTPDLDLHCARVNRSALALNLAPTLRPEEIAELTQDGIRKFGERPELYIRPMYWPEEGAFGQVAPAAESTRFCLCLYESPMPKPAGSSITLSPFRRPTLETMPLDAKAGCLYPNNARAILDARRRGFENALLLDMLGNVAELATANVFMAKDGVVHTPAPNGTFLNGITRQRVIGLMRAAGLTVIEGTLSYKMFVDADEIFQAGNYGKVQPITKIDDRELQPGPMFRKARELYWEFAHG
jgi:branched-chain amino acid aminotransferase